MSTLVRNRVQVRGKKTGTPLVFAHGFGCRQEDWSEVAQAFEGSHRVISFDQVGSGASDLTQYDKTKYGSYAGYASDLAEILDELDLHDVTFVGHSAGAMIGALASQLPGSRIARLVMVAPSPHYCNDGDYHGGMNKSDVDALLAAISQDHRAWATATAPYLMGNPDRPQLAQRLTQNFQQTRADIFHHFATTVFRSDHRDDLQKIAVPTLILQCAEDAVVPAEVGKFMKKRMPGAELVNLKATGHFPHLSAKEELTQAIRKFAD